MPRTPPSLTRCVHAMRTMALLAIALCVDLPPIAALAAAQAPQPAPETPPASRSFRSLASEVPQARDVRIVRQLRIAWTRPAAAPNADAGVDGEPRTLALVAQRVVPGALRRERFPQLSYDRLVVVVRDAAGRELDWRLVRNPALVRAEAPGPDGRLQGRVIELDSGELSIAIPDVAGAERVYLYRPRWTGAEYLLESFGQVRVAP